MGIARVHAGQGQLSRTLGSSHRETRQYFFSASIVFVYRAERCVDANEERTRYRANPTELFLLPRVEFNRLAKATEQSRVLVFAGITGRQQSVTNDDRIGARKETQSSHLVRHRPAARAVTQQPLMPDSRTLARVFRRSANLRV